MFICNEDMHIICCMLFATAICLHMRGIYHTSNLPTHVCLTGATIIRKRDGNTRLATPLEEMKRSWGGKQPMYLEVAHTTYIAYI